MTKPMIEPLPCPFCNQKAETTIFPDGEQLARCTGKFCGIFEENGTWSAIEEWNKRADEINKAKLAKIEAQFRDSLKTMQDELDSQREVIQAINTYVEKDDLVKYLGVKNMTEPFKTLYKAFLKYKEKQNGKNSKR